MKKLAGGVIGLAALFFGMNPTYGQDSKNEQLKVTKRTYMERFEPNLVKSIDERLELKKARIAEMKKNRFILDTLDISERRRRALQKDLKENPFSRRLSKTLAETDFTEEMED